ncbi:MAG: hypothetical protein DI613_18615 [Kocuria rhizophila]|uniref:DUF4145 domain-containing protein n=1 Tax=Micrococcus endophyticus TaxID=455343 RepID=UPI000DB2108C|nr:DUF4145 domain-containing protein [Micrococcus endophyticus]MCK6089910.1 DUF4145 domain-containing protein [Micrococcus endophyticus]PZP22234.1 MAG: hypothetical protein DI613_18615 [Kocuria rhizophila]
MDHIFENMAGVCPHCQTYAAMEPERRTEIYPRHADLGQEPYRPSPTKYSPSPTSGAREIVVMQCHHCEQNVTVMDSWSEHQWDEGTEPRLLSRTLVYPLAAARQLPAEAPEQMRSLYREASLCESAGAPRAAGVLYRAATEEMVKDQGGTGRDLKAKINSLAPRVDGELLQDLHESRVVGNDSIHEAVQYAAEEIADIAELLREAAVILYEQPAQKARMRAARQARHDAARESSIAP